VSAGVFQQLGIVRPIAELIAEANEAAEKADG
jgi:hypothetical protein